MSSTELAARPTELVICAACGAENPTGEQTHCTSCGSPLRILEPLVVDCGWCGSSNHRERTAHCVSCGGLLPSLPGGNPGPRPPEIPRFLPEGYRNRRLWWKNTLVMIGLIFSTVFCWSVIFPIIGIPMLIYGRKKAERELLALEQGRATRGRITDIYIDTTETINNRHPWMIRFAFDLHEGGSAEAEVRAWDPSHRERKPEDAVWVVYHDDASGRAANIWPPLH